jgi:hypothetical protein
MDMVTVYRYETQVGTGPYFTCEWVTSALLSAHEYDDLHPGPYDDFGRFPLWTERFACPSRELLAEWFTGWEAEMKRSGLRVVTYTVPADCVEIGESGRQCMFRSDDKTGTVYTG